MGGQPRHDTRPHARLQPIFLCMDAGMTSQLNVALIRKLHGSLMCLAYTFNMLSTSLFTTSQLQTSGRLMSQLNVCTVHETFENSGKTKNKSIAYLKEVCAACSIVPYVYWLYTWWYKTMGNAYLKITGKHHKKQRRIGGTTPKRQYKFKTHTKESKSSNYQKLPWCKINIYGTFVNDK